MFKNAFSQQNIEQLGIFITTRLLKFAKRGLKVNLQNFNVTFCRNVTDGAGEVLVDPVVEDDVEVLDGRVVVVDVGQLDDDEGVGSERLRLGAEQELVLATVDLVVELTLAVQDGAAGGRRVVDEEVLFVGVLQQPEFDDRVLADVRILHGYRSHLAAGRKVFLETEGDGVVGEPRRVVVEVEDGDADVHHRRHLRNSCVVSFHHQVVVLAALPVQRPLGPDDAGNRVDGESALVVRLSNKSAASKIIPMERFG